MLIDDRIFNELIPIDTSNFYQDEDPDFETVYYALGENEVDLSSLDKNDIDYENTCMEQIHQAMTVVNIWTLKRNSVLMLALIEYFGGYQEALSKIRSAVACSDEIYFVTGGGYDIIDKDLLGGDGSGKTKDDFLKKINQNKKLTAIQDVVNQSLKTLDESDIELALELERRVLDEERAWFDKGYEEGFRHAMSKIKTLLTK